MTANDAIGPAPACPLDAALVHASVPVGVAVVDATGVVRDVNAHVSTMLGRRRDEILGRSVLDVTHPDDLELVLDLMVDGARWPGRVSGPFRARYVDAAGAVRTTDIWSRNCIGVAGVDGFVLTLAEASVGECLVAATRSAAAGEPIDATLEHVVAGLARHPFGSRAAVLHRRDGVVQLTGSWPLGSTIVLDERSDSAPAGAPWDDAWREGRSTDVVRTTDLDGPLRAACRGAGVEAIWCRPVTTADRQISGVVVVWRTVVGAPTTIQQQHLDDVVATTALALDQMAHRTAIERAAYVDALTGLGNRARLDQLLGLADDDIVGVLYIDLDGFSRVNDAHGHRAGDEVLVQVGDRIRNALRSRDEVLRIAGDEFVVICRAPGSPGGLDVVADRVAGVLGAPYLVSGVREPVDVPASIGADSGEPGRRLSERVAWADEAMYSAKTFGKSTWRRRLDHSMATADVAPDLAAVGDADHLAGA